MASDKQIRANRRNAAKSTGPRTAEGKASSSRNALVHGLTAQHIILDGEDARLFATINCRLVDQFKPSNVTEEFLVDRLAGLIWRLRRAPVFEASLLAWIAHQQTNTNGSIGLVVGNVFVSSNGVPEDQRLGLQDPHQIHRRYLTGRTLERVLGDDDILSRLGRYELVLMRQVERTIDELEKCRHVRRLRE